MEIDELIAAINNEMKSKNPWLRLIAHLKENDYLLYINEDEFKALPEYKLLHELANYQILHKDESKNLIKFSTNSNTLKVLTNPREFFYKLKGSN